MASNYHLSHLPHSAACLDSEDPLCVALLEGVEEGKDVSGQLHTTRQTYRDIEDLCQMYMTAAEFILESITLRDDWPRGPQYDKWERERDFSRTLRVKQFTVINSILFGPDLRDYEELALRFAELMLASIGGDDPNMLHGQRLREACTTFSMTLECEPQLLEYVLPVMERVIASIKSS